METMHIYDSDAEANIEVEVVSSTEIEDGTYHVVTVWDMTFAIIEHDDGTVVSQNDWQGETVPVEQIADERWRDVTPVPDASMTRDRAEFRAIRETVGMTQQALADMLAVQVRSVKRWEQDNLHGWYEPPDEAWQVLHDALDAQGVAVDAALDKVREIEQQQGHAPEYVYLTYWLSQVDYVSWSTDAQLGVASDWRMANANTRAAATALREHGYEVRFVNGAPVASPPADI